MHIKIFKALVLAYYICNTYFKDNKFCLCAFQIQQLLRTLKLTRQVTIHLQNGPFYFKRSQDSVYSIPIAQYVLVYQPVTLKIYSNYPVKWCNQNISMCPIYAKQSMPMKGIAPQQYRIETSGNYTHFVWGNSQNTWQIQQATLPCDVSMRSRLNILWPNDAECMGLCPVMQSPLIVTLVARSAY